MKLLLKRRYGLEGSRINRPPYKCKSIIKEHSACPFTAASTAQDEMDAVGVPRDVQDKAMSPQAACACHFRAATGMAEQGGNDGRYPEVFNSPNYYFAAAVMQNKLRTSAVANAGASTTAGAGDGVASGNG